jgi:4-alpha-glucanotransferase
VQHDLAAGGIEDDDLVRGLVRLTLSSRARVAILPMQDVLELGGDTRMNRPGTFGGSNWQWRLEPGQASAAVAERLREETAEAGRLAPVARRVLAATG